MADRFTTRRLVMGGCVWAALVTAFTSVPTHMTPPGSPGTDPDAGAIVYENVAGALGVPILLLILAWAVVIAAIWRRPRGPAVVGGTAALAGVMAVGCALVAFRGYGIGLIGYDQPQAAEAAYHLWRFLGAGLMAAEAGVLILEPAGRERPSAVIGPMASGFVLATAGLVFFPWGSEPPSTLGPVLAVGLGFLAAFVLIAAVIAPLWRGGRSSSGPAVGRRILAALVAIVGIVVAGRSIYQGVWESFSVASARSKPLGASSSPSSQRLRCPAPSSRHADLMC